jgi:hypothetical protein
MGWALGPHLLDRHPLKQHDAAALIAGREEGAIPVELHGRDDIGWGFKDN